MSSQTLTLDALTQHALVDAEQWALLQEALGQSTLWQCAHDCLQEIDETWLAPDVDPSTWDDAQYFSAAHRSAGVTGTMAFQGLQSIFSFMEKPEHIQHKMVCLKALGITVLQAKQWLHSQSDIH